MSFFFRARGPGSRHFGNPLGNLLVMLAGAIMVGLSLVIGFFAFLVLAGLFIVLGTIVGLRAWWVGRQLRKQAEAVAEKRERQSGADVIEGEYRVLSSRDGKSQD